MDKNDEMMSRPRFMGPMFVVAAVLIMVGMIGAAYVISQGNYAPNVYTSAPPADHAISVSSTASQKATPDQLDIQLRVQTDDSSANLAQQDNAVVSSQLTSKLLALGIANQSIQTVSYNVQPLYNNAYVCDSTGVNCHYNSTITGYEATQTINVELTDLSKGGQVIDTASTTGINQTFVDSVQFSLQDATKNAIEKQLLQQASADAKVKAQSIATGAGVTLGKVISVSESVNYPIPYSYNTMAMVSGAAAPSVPTQLSPGQVEVTASVDASFQIS